MSDHDTSLECPDAPSIDEIMRFLRAEREGALRFGEHVRQVKFVADNDTGHLVAPVMVAAFDTFDHALFIPDESDDALQLLLTPEPIDGESSPAADRWRIYHGDPIDIRWVRWTIESARLGPWVYDGAALMQGNPLAKVEPAICKRLNAAPESLRSVCERFAGVPVAEPVCVGVDPHGLHVRARFGVVRVPFDPPAHDADAAAARLDTMLLEGGA